MSPPAADRGAARAGAPAASGGGGRVGARVAGRTAATRAAGTGRPGFRSGSTRVTSWSLGQPLRPAAAAALGLVVALVALAARLTPVLRGGGLRGMGNYDDGVYYSGALALVHGRVPYGDFLFLHPPGILILLSPFAELGRLTSDSTGLAAARVACMLLGALTAALAVQALRPLGAFPAVAGGLFYAVFYPAVYAEHSTLLEGVGSFFVMVALVLLSGPPRPVGAARRPGPARPAASARWRSAYPVVTPRRATLAGVALGLATTVKVWAVPAVLAVAVVQGAVDGRRQAIRVLAGAVAAVTVVCAPFLLAAPTDMPRLVVLDQLGRPRPPSSWLARVSNMLAVTVHLDLPRDRVALVAVMAVVALGAVVAAWGVRAARTAVVLLAVLTIVLLASPTWFLHYPALVAAPGAVVVGAATARLGALLPADAPALSRRVPAAALLVFLALYATPGLQQRLTHRFPVRSMNAAARQVPGCVTADDPTALVLMNVLSRDLDRGCPVEVDVTGYTYDVDDVRKDGETVPRRVNQLWQRHLRTYLLSGQATMVVRPDSDDPDWVTQAALDRLPVLRQSRHYALLGR